MAGSGPNILFLQVFFIWISKKLMKYTQHHIYYIILLTHQRQHDKDDQVSEMKMTKKCHRSVVLLEILF